MNRRLFLQSAWVAALAAVDGRTASAQAKKKKPKKPKKKGGHSHRHHRRRRLHPVQGNSVSVDSLIKAAGGGNKK
jgi:hypothetical protein